MIIPANRKVPAEEEKSFALLDEIQTGAEATIASGPHHADPADCKIYGKLLLKDLPPRSPDKDSITVRYGFTADGELSITMTDAISGKSTSDIIRGLGGLVDQN